MTGVIAIVELISENLINSENEWKHYNPRPGMVGCANAGADVSNVSEGTRALLPVTLTDSSKNKGDYSETD
jgi:F420-0:gamma-glutamyl ligase